MSDILAKLNKALKPKPAGAAAETSLRHENEVAILDSARKLLAKSETGAALLGYAQEKGIQMHVLRGPEKHGFFPEKSTIYISCPAGQAMPTVRAVIHLAGGLREAMLEDTEHLKTPHIRAGKERFLRAQLDRGGEIVMWQAEVVYQLVQATGLLEIIDEFAQMGYLSVYEVYKREYESNASGV